MTLQVENRYAVGIDIGGTKISAGVVTLDGVLHGLTTAPTPEQASNQTITAILTDLVDRLRDQYPQVEAVGVGAAGTVDWNRGTITWAPNNAYRNFPLSEVVGNATGLPVVVDNDANTAAWAEARLGRGGPYRNMAFVTVGTGIGAGIVLDGALYRGRGLAGEIGHLVVNPAGPRCGCGARGCLETMASGTALQRIGAEILGTSGSPINSRPTGREILADAHAGKPYAAAAFDRVGKWLGIGLAALVNVLDVDAIVLGGGLVETGELLLKPARHSMAENMFASTHRPPVDLIAGTFGKEAGVIGAGHLALISHGFQAADTVPKYEVATTPANLR